MSDVIDFTQYKQKQSVVDERKFTPELVKEYKQTIGLVLTYQDDLSNEDWKSCFGMMLAFNNILMIELSKHLEE